MTIRVPTASLRVDGTDYTGPQAGLSQAIIDVGQGRAHDRARLVVGWLSPLAAAAPGAEVEVGLGYEDATETVLTGDVDEVSRREWGVVIDVLAQPARLTKLRIGRSYVEMAAGDIVGDLINEGDVAAGDVDTGPTLAAFHVDERAHAWAHVNRLSQVAACELSTGADGSLNFRLAPGAEAGGAIAAAAAGAAASLLGLGSGKRYGAEIHEMALATAAAATGEATVAPFGAASELGAASWHILVKEPNTAGGAGTLVPAALRNREVAAQLAASLNAATQRGTTAAWVTVTGDPAVRAGATVEFAELPHGDDMTVRITSLQHHFSTRSGFVTRLRAEGSSS